jgi:ribonuclease HII
MQTQPSLTFERRLWKHGFTCIAGMDEAGRGALAGPVAVGMVILPMGARRTGAWVDVRDSKQMSPRQREVAAEHIKRAALAWSVGFASAAEIDSGGIVQAARLAGCRALERLGLFPDYLLTDFRLELPELDICQTSLVKGDALCLSVAAASVLAKTARDRLMRDLDSELPGYGLAAHKGYGTAAHLTALRRMGVSPIHRRSFSLGI